MTLLSPADGAGCAIAGDDNEQEEVGGDTEKDEYAAGTRGLRWIYELSPM